MARALVRLDEDPLTRVVSASSLYATTPVGMGDAPEFLNAAAEIRTERDPEALLDLCLAIEADLGRVRAPAGEPAAGPGRWKSRTIDLDILAYGARRLEGDRLAVPHPRMKERTFVLVPLAEIASEWMLDGHPIAFWTARVATGGIRRLTRVPLWPRPLVSGS
jgi:2-amino-4-hydroxy-6-hydroxymethyldihydropteridine diphosphokinase